MTVRSNKDATKVLMGETAASGTSATFTFQPASGIHSNTYQFDFSAAGTVSLQGRLSPEAPWVQLALGGGSVIFEHPKTAPQIRFVWTGNTGSIDAWMMSA